MYKIGPVVQQVRNLLGLEKGEKRKKYPACRPTKAECNDAKNKKTGSARISWQKKSTGGPMSKFGMDDGVQTSYEKKRGAAIDRAMSTQNRIKKQNGGFIAKGCGKVMNNNGSSPAAPLWFSLT